MIQCIPILVALALVAGCGSQPSAREAPPIAPGDARRSAANPEPPPEAKLGWPAVDGRIPDDGSPLRVLGDPRLRARGRIYGVALNATRSRLATTHEHSIRVWTLPAGTLAFEVPIGGTWPVFVGETLGAFAPFRGKSMRWWNADGREVPAPYPGCAGRIATGAGLIACPQIAPVAVRVHGTVERTVILDGLSAFETAADGTAISPDGKWLVASTGYRVFGFDLATGRRAWVRELRTAPDCFGFDRRGLLLVGEPDPHHQRSVLSLLDAADGTEVVRRSVATYLPTCDVAGDVVVTISGEGHAQLFSLPGLEPGAALPSSPTFETGALSADGRSVWVSADNEIAQWELDHQRWAPTSGHDGEVLALALSPDGATIATVGRDGKLLLWPIDGGEPRVMRAGGDHGLTAVAFSPDGKALAVGSAADSFPDLKGPPDERSVIERWDVATGKRVFRVKRSKSMIQSLGFAANGRLYALTSYAELATLDAKTGALRARRQLAPELGRFTEVGVSSSEFAPNATAFVAWLSAGKDHGFVAETMDGKSLNGNLPIEGSVRAAGFGRDGKPWWCGSDPCTPDEMTTGRPVAADAFPVLHVYAPDDPTYATPMLRGGVIVLAHQSSSCNAFHPDGKRFIACSPDGLVRIWDLATLRQEP